MPRNQIFLHLFDTANRYTLHSEQFNNNEDLFKKINLQNNVSKIHNISKRYINQKNKKERKEYYVLEL